MIVLFVCLRQRNATKYNNKLCLTKYKKVLRNNISYYNNNTKLMTMKTMETSKIKLYAEKYLRLLEKQREQQRAYAKTEKGRQNVCRRNLKRYYLKNNIYHPLFNTSQTAREGQKYKRNKIAVTI